MIDLLKNLIEDYLNSLPEPEEMDKIEKRIREMLSDIDIYRKMSHNAITRAQLYDSDNMTEKIANTIRLFYGH